MARIAIGVEYDGRGFSGWEVQRDRRTVQGVVEQALGRVANHRVSTVCAGRTDAGVHATGQVLHFDTTASRPQKAWVRGTNRYLPTDAVVTWAREVPERFHARYSAIQRSYRYVIMNRPIPPAILSRRVTWQYRPLDVCKMHRVAQCLVGKHDFSAFRAAGCQAKSPWRTVHQLSVHRQVDLVFIDITANAFLQHMVRNIAGALMEVGYGKREAGWFEEVLETRDRTQGGVTGAPDGLYMIGVEYPPEMAIPAISPGPGLWYSGELS